ncbi:hypothetical protein CAMGR0001_2042 [Campylobacter gracilis RM3268]|uniref:Uncharacterized protein n=1 Tax=Campylobacter gracilis RM3268 TaxID=553220 RepID=C8PLN2_9BACT|nr:hypothetical protein CAMGR0001_2042 [Campylobacter gracilis RM3268]
MKNETIASKFQLKILPNPLRFGFCFPFFLHRFIHVALFA